MADVSLTWLGHASLRFDTPGGKRIYVDPFLNRNPKCPESELEPERVDLIALTHGHGDHLGDTVALHKKFGCYVLAPVELHDWLVHPAGRRPGQGHRPEQGRHRRLGGHQDHAHPRAALVVDARRHLRRRAGRPRVPVRERPRRSTSPATRTCSATCS